jgi:hypothetical protein
MSLARLRGGRKGFRAAVFQGGDWHLTGGAELRPDTGKVVETIALIEGLLVQALFGIPLERWLELESHETLQEWAACSTAARLLSKVLGAELSGFGRSTVAPMPSIPVEALERALAADHSGQFVAAPMWQGQVYETGALTRQLSHPLVSDLFVRYGNGLLTRLAARLVELAAIPGRMRELALYDAMVFGDSLEPSAPIGMGRVEAARGRLVHRVEVAKGRVRRYQILAPTEWNFHPRGPLVQGLAGMRADGMDDLYRRVSLVAGALDPCVAYEVEVTGHA